ncbi:MAG: endonuclease/exonuclease/phosphatase family protein [Planctomycetales bacterium]|nr:endonuclease/exonuclease/phosphatase family protein [Planctomycetales bacterium]
MQRLLPLALLAALLGGGWMYLGGPNSKNLGGLLEAGRRAVEQSTQQQGPVYGGPSYPSPAQSPSGPAYVPSPAPQGATIKIATYNIEKFGDAKAAKPYVMRVLGAIVQNLDLIAIQEVTTKDEYFIDRFLEKYVNNNGRRYARAVGPRLGDSTYKEQYAFIYDTNTIEINPQLNYTMRDSSNLMHREPQVTMFRARTNPPDAGFTFVLVNVHTDPDLVERELSVLAGAYQQVMRTSVISGVAEDDVILLGDLNTDVPAASNYQRVTGARGLTPADLYGLGGLTYLYPVVRSEATNTAGTKLNDNILVHRGATTEFTGRAGVIDVRSVWRLTAEQAEEVSDHLPVWAEFSVYESLTPGRIANQPGAVAR